MKLVYDEIKSAMNDIEHEITSHRMPTAQAGYSELEGAPTQDFTS